MGDWFKAELEKRLDGASAAHGGLRASVSKVKDVEGTASVVASRGELRHLSDYTFELEYKTRQEGGAAEEGEGEGDAEAKPTKTLARGSLKYVEVTSSKTGERVQVGDIAHNVKTAPPTEQKAAASDAVDALQQSVLAILQSLDHEYRTSKKL